MGFNEEVLEQESLIESGSTRTWKRLRENCGNQEKEQLSRERMRRRKEAKKPLYLMRYE